MDSHVTFQQARDIHPMLGQRRRRWPNIVPTLGERLVFAGLHLSTMGGGPRVVVSNAAFHARVRGLFPGLSGLRETKMFLPHPLVKLSIVGSFRYRELACRPQRLRPPGLEFRILCLKGSVISFISQSSGANLWWVFRRTEIAMCKIRIPNFGMTANE